MSQDNKLSLSIHPTDLQEIQTAITVLQNKLVPYLKELTDEERQSLPKMKDRTLAFVTKATEHAEQNTNLIPAYLDLPEWKKDFEAVEVLRQLFNSVSQIQKGLDDTMMLAGSEAYVASLTFYQSTKTAARLNVPNAKEIYDDLKVRFEGQGRRKK